MMHLQFDEQQPHQLAAISSVVKLFTGMPKYTKAFTMNANDVVANLPEDEILSPSTLKDNLDAIQSENNLPQGHELIMDEGIVLEGTGFESWAYPSFTVEMETGTGKTYVYLRTIYELRKTYGFGKFIIVVPSIAIYEGVIKTFDITREHFRTLYDNETVHRIPYDGSKPGELKSFATSSFCEVLIMTLDSFNRVSNTLYKETDKLTGSPLRPYEYLQQTRPILILDESQNMESEGAKTALRTLHPLFALWFSATPTSNAITKPPPNVVYKLTPVDALRQGLVKKIEVYGVTEQENYNLPYLALLSVSAQGSVIAQVRTVVEKNGTLTDAEFTLGKATNLHKLTGRTEHQGYIVDNISAVAGDQFVSFTNGEIIRPQEIDATSRQAVFRQQIRETIQRHFEKQNRMLSKGIKVLSLFFIDKVSNYTDQEKGIIRIIFDEEYTRLSKGIGNEYFSKFKASDVRSAYFAEYRKKVKGEPDQWQPVENEETSIKEEKAALKEAFALIMKKKEVLLTLPGVNAESDSQVAFIFAHSALKEGWDNPNVFQICTLNQTVSDRKKRQEIGRGLRLCVDQQGERKKEEGINVLTVIANESYESYVDSLQKEYTSTGLSKEQLGSRPSNARKPDVKRNPAVFTHPEFALFWQKLATRLDYTIRIDTEKLIAECSARLKRTEFPNPTLLVQKGEFIRTEFTITVKGFQANRALLQIQIIELPQNSRKEIEQYFKAGDDLSKTLRERRLKGYVVKDIVSKGYDPYVTFTNEARATKAYPIQFSTEMGQRVFEKPIVHKSEETYPVFDLITRAANESQLTRQTILSIFSGLRNEQKEALTKNPEGFAAKFISTIKAQVGRHMAENIEYQIKDEEPYNLEELFPNPGDFVQKELMEAGPNSIYDYVQVDSEVERRFVDNRLKQDEEQLVFYFKFPPKYKIILPKMVHNYNPDWGIVRRDQEGRLHLHLIRETKGSMDKEALRFENEGLKVTCAERYYAKLGISYRQITDKLTGWYHDRTDDGQINVINSG
jgi:type III restriction enzyme